MFKSGFFRYQSSKAWPMWVLMAVAVTCRDAMAETVEELTPLKKKLDDFGTFLSKVTHTSSSRITQPIHSF